MLCTAELRDRTVGDDINNVVLGHARRRCVIDGDSDGREIRRNSVSGRRKCDKRENRESGCEQRGGLFHKISFDEGSNMLARNKSFRHS